MNSTLKFLDNLNMDDLMDRVAKEKLRAEDARKYPTGNLTDEQRAEAVRNGRIQFVSAGATRKR